MNDAPLAPAEPLLRTLAPALRELEKRVRLWQTAKHRQPLSALQKATLEGLAHDLDRQADALQQDTPLLIIMLMGGTGVGKSTLLNALAGGAIAQASLQRPTTRDPVVYYHESIQPQRLDPALQLCKLAAHERPALTQKILVDTPDLDSNDLSNRDKLLKLLPIADIVLYVGSQEKYHDRLGWELFLEHRQRRAFAFVLNKWDRCQHPGASGRKPDDDLLDDLHGQGFENPLIFRTCAQHWVDHPWQNVNTCGAGVSPAQPSAGETPAPQTLPPPVEGEQFLELLRWLEAGLNRLEIEAIKARGVSQLLQQLQQAMEAQCPSDITAAAQRVGPVWERLMAEEAQAATATLLNTLEPYQKEIEHHFAIERQKQFTGVMAFYLRWFNRLRYAGSGLRDKLPFIPRLATPVSTPKSFDLAQFTEACSKAAFEQNLDARQRALANRLLVEANTIGVPLQLLSDQAESVSRQDWKGKHAQAMMDILEHVERSWTQPAGVRRVLQKSLIFLADWLPVVAVGGMATWMLAKYTISEPRWSFQFSDLFMPLVVVVMVMIVLHVLIVIFLPLNWKTIRADFERQLQERLLEEMTKTYGPLPGELAQDLLAERRHVEQFVQEIREIATWLAQREQAASITALYGK